MNRTYTGLLAAALLLASQSNALAGSRASATSAKPVGQIVGIDRSARTLQIKDAASNTVTTVRIPRSADVAIAPISSIGSSIAFERVTIGMGYRGIR